MRIHSLPILSAILFAAACGDSGHDVNPELITGGGIADPGIDGEVNIHVIDELTDEPIEGAQVLVGTIEGETDADGLFVAALESLSGPQVITVVASGHVATTWVGVDGANVTIPLGLPMRDTAVQSGTITGSIEGFEDLTVPADHARIALVTYTANHDDNDPANELDQGDPAGNVCASFGGPAAACSFTLETRTGPQTVYALIGTMDAAENLEIDGFAYASGLDVSNNEFVTSVDLTIVDAADLDAADISLPSAPSGTDEVVALVQLDLGDDGRMLLPQTPEITVPVPALSLFPGVTYDVIAIASSTDDPHAESAKLMRGLDSVDSVSMSAMMRLPTGLSTDATTFEFEAVDGATAHLFGVEDADGEVHWSVAVFDDSVAVDLPDLVELPDGTLTYLVTAIEIPDVDLRDFTLDGIEDTVVAAATAATTWSN